MKLKSVAVFLLLILVLVLNVGCKKTETEKNKELKSLVLQTVEGKSITLEPDFRASVTSYSALVNADVKEIRVVAEPDGKNAKIEGAGTHKIGEEAKLIKITVTAENGDKKEYIVNIQKRKNITVSGITLNITSAALKIGGQVTISAIVKMSPETATPPAVIYKSSNTSVAAVTTTGVITGISAGNAVITAKAGDKTAEVSVTIKKEEVVVTVSGITLNITSAALKIGGQVTISAIVKMSPETATPPAVIYKSSNTSVAAVTTTGVITGISAGNTVITAKAGDKTAEVFVTIKKEEVVVTVSGITLNITSAALKIGGQVTISAIVKMSPETATPSAVIYKSSNTSVAAVTTNGVITGISAGNAVITAKAGDKTAEVVIEVLEPAKVFTEEGPTNFKYMTKEVEVATSTTSGIQTHRFHFDTPDEYNSDKSKAFPLIISLYPWGYPNSEEALSIPEWTFGHLTDNSPYGTMPGDNLPSAFQYTPICPPPYSRETGGPNAPDGGEWNSPAAKQMIMSTIKELSERFNIDINRVYLHGFSMGGAGVWYIAQEFYDTFGIPVAGINRVAGYTPTNEMLDQNMFPDVYKSKIWYHVGEKDTMALNWDKMGNIDLAKYTYSKIKEQLGEGVETTTTRTIGNGLTDGSDSLEELMYEYAVGGVSKIRVSIYKDRGHEDLSIRNIDFPNWLFTGN